MTKVFFLLLAVLSLCNSSLRAQGRPEKGGHELQLWIGGGHAINGSESDDGIFNVGGRYGWILTQPHGPGFLRGNFEYAVDVVPIFLITQRTGTTYGIGINPVGLKWNFTSHPGAVPYMELDAGTLFTNVQTPVGGSRVNFTTGGTAGIHFLRRKYNWSAEVRYMHISSAGIGDRNPGINTIQFRLGFGLFGHRK